MARSGRRGARDGGSGKTKRSGRHVVVVESPVKARTIGGYLGREYRVIATRGHVRDLPAKAGSVKPEDGFSMVTESGKRAARTLAAVAKALAKAESLVLATDPDREGEAIAWQVLEWLTERDAIGDVPVHRVAFHEVTPTAVRTALSRPRNLDMDLVRAWQARRALDYLVGYGLSPLLWRKLPGCRSAGRVQSVALRLVCEREAEIEAFAPRHYRTVHAELAAADGAAFPATLVRLDGREIGEAGFDGEADGLSLDGDVTTFTFGADVARGRWLGGVALAHSTGEGGYRDHDDSGDPNHPGRGSGTLESSLTSVHPYARLAVSERLSLWGILGYGAGDLTLAVDAAGNRPRQSWKTDTEMWMAAAGARGVLLSAADHDGFELAARGDARLVRMNSDAATGADGAGRLSESEAQTSRLRFILEGSHRIEFAGGQTLTPSLEVGLRHDGGDAETGTGIELGGGVSYADPATGLTVTAKARGLLAHEDADYTEWGASGSVKIDPGAAGRGLSLSLSPAWGADSGNAERLWGLADARGLAGNDGFEPAGRLDAEAGWGFGAFGGRGLATPFAGLSLSDAGERTWRSGVRWTLGPDTAFGVEGSLREAANDNEAEHGIGLKLTARW